MSIENMLVYKDIEINLNTRIVRRGDIVLRLPHKEYILLLEFMNSPEKILSKEYLLEKVCAIYFPLDTTRIEVHVCNLRKKLDRMFEEKRIQTVPCAGYMLN